MIGVDVGVLLISAVAPLARRRRLRLFGGATVVGDLFRHCPSSGGDIIILRDLNTLAWWPKSTPVFARRSSSATC
jgi:hypothetical protein